jgi:hypothetical protein
MICFDCGGSVEILICVLDVRQPVITEYVMNGINENKIIYIYDG